MRLARRAKGSAPASVVFRNAKRFRAPLEQCMLQKTPESQPVTATGVLDYKN